MSFSRMIQAKPQTIAAALALALMASGALTALPMKISPAVIDKSIAPVAAAPVTGPVLVECAAIGTGNATLRALPTPDVAKLNGVIITTSCGRAPRSRARD